MFPRLTRTSHTHLLDKMIPEPNSGCWLWTAAVNRNGYGIVGARTRMNPTGEQAAHRAVYRQIRGDIPAGLTLDHLCRVRCCVNPDHLEPVTQRENSLRGTTCTRNRAKTHCPQGHPYSGENLYMRYGKHRICRECMRASGRRWYRRVNQLAR